MRYLSAAFPPAFFLVIARHPLSVCRCAAEPGGRRLGKLGPALRDATAASEPAIERVGEHVTQAQQSLRMHAAPCRRVAHREYYLLCLRNWLNAYEWAHADLVTGNLTYFWTFYEVRDVTFL